MMLNFIFWKAFLLKYPSVDLMSLLGANIIVVSLDCWFCFWQESSRIFVEIIPLYAMTRI